MFFDWKKFEHATVKTKQFISAREKKLKIWTKEKIAYKQIKMHHSFVCNENMPLSEKPLILCTWEILEALQGRDI